MTSKHALFIILITIGITITFSIVLLTSQPVSNNLDTYSLTDNTLHNGLLCHEHTYSHFALPQQAIVCVNSVGIISWATSSPLSPEQITDWLHPISDSLLTLQSTSQ